MEGSPYPCIAPITASLSRSRVAEEGCGLFCDVPMSGQGLVQVLLGLAELEKEKKNSVLTGERLIELASSPLKEECLDSDLRTGL